jgi:molecular chaperone HtpG
MTMRLQVDLAGLIQVLSKHLYSSPRVFLRELLQNAVDAVTARRRQQLDHRGNITIEVHSSTLVITDNGLGLTEDEIHRFLATIGSSSKRGTEASRDFIGQFGIGLLSGFLVSDEITVITRSCQPEQPALEWVGRADGTYSLRTLESAAVGTQVFLKARPGCQALFAPDQIREQALHYGRHLPFTLKVISAEKDHLLNSTPPWAVPYPDPQSRQAAFLDYGEKVLEQTFLDAFPLRSASARLEGIGYIQPHTTQWLGGRKQSHTVYLRNMLVCEKTDRLLPNWAFFVTCVVDAKELTPTASREALYEDESLYRCRQELGESIKDYLKELAQSDPSRLRALIALHFLALKALALEDDEFYLLFIDWFPFQTNLGTMTLPECLSDGAIRYAPEIDSFRQISSIAAAQGTCVINAGYTFDQQLLQKLPAVRSHWRLERMDATSLIQTFDDLDLTEREKSFQLVRTADLTLMPFQCAAEIRKFEPRELPALYTLDQNAQFARTVQQTRTVTNALWGGVVDAVAEGRRPSKAKLCLNYSNPLIQRLTAIDDPKLIKLAVEAIYVQSLLLGHYPLTPAETRLLSSGLDLWEYHLNGGQTP